MNLQVWANLVKRVNSTFQPSHAADQVLEVSLKKDTSLLKPTFTISGNIEPDIVNINYCAWAGHYYFVDDVIFLTNRHAELKCSIDALATHKGDLLLQTFFIERAATNYSTEVYDPMVAQKTTNGLLQQTSSDPLQKWSERGTYIVRVIGDNDAPTTALGITTYVLTPTDMNDLLNRVFDSGRYDFLSDNTVKSFFNPFQYIVSVMWFPFSIDAFSVDTDQPEITLGWFKTGYHAFTLKSPRFTGYTNLKRPEERYNDFRDQSANWTTLRVLIPGVGAYIMNPVDFGHESIRINYSVDCLTGESSVYIYQNVGGTPTGGFISQLSGRMGVPVQIGQLTANYASGATNIVSGLGNLLTGKLGDAFSDAVQATTEICQPTPSVNGSAGNAASLIYSAGKAYASVVTRGSRNIAVNEVGRPVMQADILNKYSGYVKCSNANVILKGTREEREIINRYLNGGFFIE